MNNFRMVVDLKRHDYHVTNAYTRQRKSTAWSIVILISVSFAGCGDHSLHSLLNILSVCVCVCGGGGGGVILQV